MIDTVQIYKTFFREPNYRFLINNGWRMKGFYGNDKPRKLTFKERGEPSPFLEILNTNQNKLFLRAAVSFPHWLFGSNLHLPVNRDITEGLKMLSDFVTEKSGIFFNAKIEKVRRVDYTRDFKLGQTQVLQSLKKYQSFTLPRYDRFSINDSTVYFQNKGKEKTKIFKLYDKFQERLDKNGTPDEIEMAEGILRFEFSLKRNAVHRLAKSLRIRNEAGLLLDASVAIPIIENAINTLKLRELLETTKEAHWELAVFKNKSLANPHTLIGHLHLEEKFGHNYANIPGIKIEKRTLQRYRKSCREIGVFP